MEPAHLLLCSPSAILRHLVLTTLIDEPDEEEVEEARRDAFADPLLTDLLARQQPDGSWSEPETSWALFTLGALGLDASHEAVAKGAEHIFSRQRPDGSWPMPTTSADDGSGRPGYDTVPLQTALPLIGLAATGYATDERSARAYTWLLAERLEDGSWPAGRADGVFGYIAGYRRLPHSRWGCRSNTTGAALALSLHPTLRADTRAQRAVEQLLARESRDQACLGFETARLFGFEPVRGFFTRFARFDPALILELAVAVGAGSDDPRVAELEKWVREQREPGGLWRYRPNANASHWVSYRLLTTLRALGPGSRSWRSHAPRTPFAPYPRLPRRF